MLSEELTWVPAGEDNFGLYAHPSPSTSPSPGPSPGPSPSPSPNPSPSPGPSPGPSPSPSPTQAVHHEHEAPIIAAGGVHALTALLAIGATLGAKTMLDASLGALCNLVDSTAMRAEFVAAGGLRLIVPLMERGADEVTKQAGWLT